MASFVTKNFYLTLNAVDLTAWIESVELDDDFDEVDFTDMASGGNREFLAGLGEGSITINFQQDYAASAVDATLWAARGTVVTIALRPTSAAQSTTNPTYSASYLISKNKAVSGKVGDKTMNSVTFKRSGALTRTAV